MTTLLRAAKLAKGPALPPPLRAIHVAARPNPAIPAPVYMQAARVAEHIGYDLLAGNTPPDYGEVMALLYASSHPRNEWAARVIEALEGARL